jgi:dihydroorotase
VNPRKVMNIDRDLFEIGKKAQITILDPNQKWTFSNEDIYSKSSNSPFIGEEMVGKVKYVLSKSKFYTL